MDLLTSNLGLLVPLAGLVGMLLGMAITVSLGRGEGDPVAPWRYREPRHEVLVPAPARRRSDALAARRIARLLIGVAILLPIVMLIAWIARPGGTGPMFYEPPWYEAALLLASAACYLFGLGWMIRIYRAEPEPDNRTWRYRSER